MSGAYEKQVVGLATSCETVDLEKVRARFRRAFGVSEDVARKCEREFKRYLALDFVAGERAHGLYSPLVDEFWHTFLLFSRDYAEFCKSMFGTQIHHDPQEPGGAASDDDGCGFADFAQAYEMAFGEPLPTIWYKRPPPRLD